MYKPSFFTFSSNSLGLSLALALIIGVIGLFNPSLATAAPTQSLSEWLFGESAASTSSGLVKACADDTRGSAVTVADCIARRGKQLLRNSTLSLGENLVETSGSALLGDNFKLKSKLSWNDNNGVQGELDAVVPVWGEAQTKGLFFQPGVAIWRALGTPKQNRTDANLGLVYRSLNSGGDTLFGSSIFYDRNLDHDNQRLALGFDVQSQLGYASFNYYHPLSNDWRQGRSGFEERALRGYDFNLEKLFYQGRIDVDLNLGAWRRNQPSKWVYTYGVDFGYKVNNYLSLNLGYEDFSGQPLSALPSNQRWQIGLKLDLMKLYAPKAAQHAGNQGPLDLWRTVSREKRILYQERERVTSPTVVISGVPSDVGLAAFTATITFSEAVTGFEENDIVVTNATLANFQGSGAVYTVEVTPIANGALSLSIAAEAAQTSTGHPSLAATTATTTVGPITIGFESANYSVVAGEMVSLTIKANRPLTADVDLTWRTRSDSARAISDFPTYTLAEVTVSMTTGQSTATFAIETFLNTVDGGEKDFSVVIESVVIEIPSPSSTDDAVEVNTTTATTTITIGAVDLTAPGIVGPITIGFESTNYNVVAGETVTLTIQANQPLTEDVVVGWRTISGSAQAVSDYSKHTTAEINVPMITGQTTATFNIETFLNTADEGEESFQVFIQKLTPADAAQINTATKITTITIEPVDRTAPRVRSIERSSPTAPRTNVDRVTWLITFDEAVENANANDFSLSGTSAIRTATMISATELEVTASGGDLAGLNADITLSFITNPTIQDVAGNLLIDTTLPTDAPNENSYTIDNIAPKVLSITGIADEVTTILLPVTITFDEAVTGFALNRIAPTNATLSSFRRDSGAVYRLDMNPTAEGPLILSIPEGAARDAAGNESEEFTVTSMAVFFSIGFEFANYRVVAGETLTLTVTANRALKVGESVNIGWTPLTVGTADLDDDITLPENRGDNYKVIIGAGESSTTITGIPIVSNFTTNADGDKVSLGEGDESFMVSLTPPRNTSYDIHRRTTTVTILGNDEDVAPTVVSIQRKTPLEARTNADSVTWSITFNEAVENVDASDFSLTSMGVPLTNVTLTPALTGTVLDVTASGGDLADLNAPITLSFASGQNIQDTMGSPLATTSPSGSNYNQHTYTIDNTAPTVAISSDAPEVVGSTPFTATITFSEAVSGFEQSDIVPFNATLGTLRGFGAVYTVEVTPIVAGELILSIAANVANDAVGNANTAALALTRTADLTEPRVVSIERAAPTNEPTGELTDDTTNDMTNANSVTWRITFNKAVKNADKNDFSLSGSTAPLTVDVDDVNDKVLNVTASGGDLASLNATIMLSFVTNPTIADAAGNPLTNTNTTPSDRNDNSYTIDNTRPTVVISDVANEIGLAPFTATITFSEAVSGFALNDIVASNATLGTFSGSDAVYTVEVTPEAYGDLSLSIAAGAAADSVGNLSLASTATTTVAPLTIGFELDNYRVVAGATVSLTITANRPLSEDVAVLWGIHRRTSTPTQDYIAPASDLEATVLMTAGQSTAIIDVKTVANTVDEGEEYFDVIIQTLTIDGTVFAREAIARVTIEAPDVFAPTVVSIERSSPTDATTNADSVTWLITFSEAVSNADASNFSLSGTTATLTVSPDASRTELDVTARGGNLADLNADVTLSFVASPTIEDLALVGNRLTNTTPSGANENSYTIDNIAPTVTIKDKEGTDFPIGLKVNAVLLVPRITFSEPVTGFAAGHIVVKNATVAALRTVSGTTPGTTYWVSVTPTASGELTLSIAAGVVRDAAGNENVAADTVTINAEVIIVSFDSDNYNVVASTTAQTTVSLTVTANEAPENNFDLPWVTYGDTARSGSDYISRVGSKVIFRAGQTTVTINVTIVANTTGEGDEQFDVSLNPPSNLPFRTPEGREDRTTVTIKAP